MEETVVKDKTEISDDTGKPKVLVLYNDDYNSFEHVEKCLIKYCKHTPEQARQSALIVHFKGKCEVAEGSDEYLKKLKLRLRAEGLSVTIENA
jgi:ATP-dependent Clp protease adaptor protein ClpS